MSSSSSRDRRKQAGSRGAEGVPRIGSYRILEVIGKGGMGTVYKAVHTGLDRVVALKVLPTEYASNPLLVERFSREAKTAAQLHHPNIVAIHDQGESNGSYYLVLEYVQGEDLHSLISKRGRLAPRRCLEIVKQTLDALAHAHSKGIIHRDIKPSNLLIRRDGVVKLADLGLARVHAAQESQVTRAGTTVGTVDYMPPEQARDSKLADARSDIYALGCTLYHLLTGQPPFPDGGIPEKLLAHAKEQPQDVQQLNAEVPDELAAVLHRMIAKEPSARYQSAQELLDDLAQLTLRRGPATRHDLASLTEAIEDDRPEKEIPVAARRSRPTAAEEQTPAPKEGARRARRPRRASSGKRSGGGLLSSEQWMYVGGGTGVLLLIALVVYVMVNMRDVTDPTGGGLNRDLPLPRGPVARQAEPAPGGETTTPSPEFPELGYVTPRGSAEPSDGKNAEPVRPALAAAPARDGFLPAWYAGAAGEAAARTLRLRRWAPAAASGETFDDLQTACDAVQPEETVAIEIADQGPFFLRDVSIRKGKKLMLRAAPGYAPLLVFDPTPAAGAAATQSDNAAHALLNATGVELELEGLHFAAMRDDSTPPGPIALVRADRHVTLRRCTFTVAQDTRFRAAGSSSAASPPVVGFGEVITADAKTQQPTGAETTGARQFAASLSAVCVGGAAAAPSGSPVPDGASGPAADSPADAPAAWPVRVVMENCFVRGAAVAALGVETPAADVVLRNLLVASGEGPAVQVISASAAQAEDKIALHVIGSTLVSQRNGILLAHEGSGNAPAAVVRVLDTIVAHPRVGRPGELLLADRWSHGGNGAAVPGVSWQSRNSRYWGWSKLVAVARPLQAVAQTPHEWSDLWGSRQPGVQFAADGWPAEPVTAPGTVTADLFEYSGAGETSPGPAEAVPVSESAQGAETTAGAAPSGANAGTDRAAEPRPAGRDGEEPPVGCALDALPALPAHLHERAFEPFAVPLAPELHRADGKNAAIRIDLSDPQTDLAQELRRAQWEEDQAIVVRGSGRRLVSPIRVQGKSLRLRFEAQRGAEPLTLVPRLGRRGEAMIEVVGGDLEIVGGRFESTKAQRSSPNWIIRATGGNVQLSNCWLQGPYPPTEHFDGVLSWEPAPGDAAPQEASEQFCRLTNCLLQGGGALIHAPMSGRHVLVENCAAATSGTVFALELGNAAEAGTLTVRQSTLWAYGTFFQVSGTGAAGKRPHLPLRLSALQCVFASPLELTGRRRRTALLRCDPLLLNEGQLAWYGKDNGYADLFGHFTPDFGEALRGEEGAPQLRSAADFDREWTRLWGPWHERHPLVDERPAWRNAERQANNLKPGDFVLAAENAALTWGPTGGTLGADVTRLPSAPPEGQRPDDPQKKPVLNF